MNKADKAVECFHEGFNCSQAVFSSHSSDLGLDDKTAKKISCGFGGGIGHTGQTCGAFSGAVMLIGLKYGKTEAEDSVAKAKTYETVLAFRDRFVSVNGAVTCPGLLGLDISKPEELEQAREKNLFRNKCDGYVRSASLIVEELLELNKNVGE